MEEIFNISEGVYDPGILKAVFLAGGPGSGKSYVSSQLFGIPSFSSTSVSGLKVVSSDIFFEYLLSKKGLSHDLASLSQEEFDKLTVGPGSVRDTAKNLSDKTYVNYLSGRLGILIDGTARDADKIIKQANILKKMYGYDVYMVFVNTSMEKALERNSQRPRKIPEHTVIDSWKDAQVVKNDYKTFFGGDFIEINNNEDSAPGQPMDVDPIINKFVKKVVLTPLQNPVGKKWISQELEMRSKK